MAKRKKNNDVENEDSFEDSLAKLQLIVKEIESGSLTLDESLVRYEEGVKRLRQCFAKLERVEQRLRLLVDIDESGIAVTKNFRHEAAFEAPQGSSGQVVDDDDGFDDDDDDENEFDDPDSRRRLF